MSRITPGAVAVVTGAASGIGRALALDLARRGCSLALCDVDGGCLAETAALVGPASGNRSEVFTAIVDVGEADALAKFAAESAEKLGPVDYVFNNAGVDLSQTVADAHLADMHWLMNINFWGVVHGTRAFLPAMIERGRGSIVNVASIFSVVAWPNHSAYVASKHAVRGFTEALRAEVKGTGVSVHVVLPGGVDTRIVANSRFYVDDLGRTDRSESAREFAGMARTSPAKAAGIILSGVERGRTRILVGRDARAMDLFARVVPARHVDIMRRLQGMVRTGPPAAPKRKDSAAGAD